MFIVVDGIDGAGKTTLCFSLKRILSQYDPIVTKEPTSNSPWAEKIRKLAEEERESSSVEMGYFHKDRIFHLKDVIYPALEKGQLVICDRYVDSTLAFQADDPEHADRLYQEFKPDILVPDITFILQCPVELGFTRLRIRDGDHLSQFETPTSLTKAAEIYNSRKGPNYRFLDATGSAENTLRQAINVLIADTRILQDQEIDSLDRNSIEPLQFRYA